MEITVLSDERTTGGNGKNTVGCSFLVFTNQDKVKNEITGKTILLFQKAVSIDKMHKEEKVNP